MSRCKSKVYKKALHFFFHLITILFQKFQFDSMITHINNVNALQNKQTYSKKHLHFNPLAFLTFNITDLIIVSRVQMYITMIMMVTIDSAFLPEHVPELIQKGKNVIIILMNWSAVILLMMMVLPPVSSWILCTHLFPFQIWLLLDHKKRKNKQNISNLVFGNVIKNLWWCFFFLSTYIVFTFHLYHILWDGNKKKILLPLLNE